MIANFKFEIDVLKFAMKGELSAEGFSAGAP